MRKAARAIIIEDGKILVMFRNKYGSEYFTLVGGRVNDDETLEQGLTREIKEETGLNITSARLVYVEEHGAPYNEQYVYLCQVAPHDTVAIQETSEEGYMNRMAANTHQPVWCMVTNFSKLQFRTPGLHAAITEGLKKGFPVQPVKL